jgi:hypothetical protein
MNATKIWGLIQRWIETTKQGVKHVSATETGIKATKRWYFSLTTLQTWGLKPKETLI